MPLTPLHYGVAYIIHRWKRKLSLPALIVSSVTPDLDTLIYLAIGGLQRRLILHSLVGAATLGTLVAVALTVCVYPRVISSIFRLDATVVRERCGFSAELVFTCMGGCVLHVLFDTLHHDYNSALYPFISGSFDALVLFNDWLIASILINSLFSLLFIFILILEVRKETKGFWERTLVGETAANF